MAVDYALPSQKKVNVVWLDVNTLIGQSSKSDLLPNVSAINNSLYNLFRCPIGARGPIFNPEYGASLYRILHEPFDYITANKIRVVLIQAVQRWEPRIDVDVGNTGVALDFSQGVFVCTIAYTLVATQEVGTGTFAFSRN